MKNDLFTIPQAAKICSVCRTTMWRWVKSGKLEAFLTPGGQFKIREKDLKSFIQKRMKHLPVVEFSQGKKILIVDDDRAIQKMLNKMMSSSGYQLEAASDGFEAGTKIMQFKPDLIILDLFMPGMDGFEVCKQIKENANTSHIKILILTGFDSKENKERIMGTGANGYLVKPVEKRVLLKNVQDLISK